MQHSVVALRGEEARKAYFGNKDLSFAEGINAYTDDVRPPMKKGDDDIRQSQQAHCLVVE